MLNELWEKLLKIDTSSVDITPKIIKQGFKTLTQIKKEEEEQELQRMIELEEKENKDD